MYGDYFDGLLSSPIQTWRQGANGILDTAEEDDLFGYAVVGADLGKSSHADLAVGVSGETRSVLSRGSGVVRVLYGASTATGLLTNDDQVWWQGSSGIEGDPELGDAFGSSLAAAGSMSVIYSTSTGLEATGDQFWWQDSSGIGDSTEDLDQFGRNLAR